jgi:hypothetical protein
MIYFLVGVEIVKQRHILKSFAANYLTLDTITATNNVTSNHFLDTIPKTPKISAVKVNPHYRSTHEIHEPDEVFFTTTKSPPTSRYPFPSPPSTSNSDISSPRPYPNAIPLPQRIHSPLSFKQYVLMPLLFFIILLAVWVAPTINRVSALTNPKFSSYPLLLTVGATGSLRGFWNGIVFVCLGGQERRRRRRIERVKKAAVVYRVRGNLHIDDYYM